MEAGWSPTAAVTARLAGGALVMAIFATIVKPDWFREALRHSRTVIAYGLIPIAGAQLCYYNAVAHLSVGVALLLEYTAPILVVGWLWATTRRRPSTLTLTGVALAVAGIMLVLNVFSGAHINVVGVGWGLAAAVCAACYFLMSDKVATDGGLNPITLAAGGLVVGAASVALLGVTGVMPLTFTTNDTVIAGLTTSWVVPVHRAGARSPPRSPTRSASSASPGCVRGSRRWWACPRCMFAVLAAWVMLGEAITPRRPSAAPWCCSAWRWPGRATAPREWQRRHGRTTPSRNSPHAGNLQWVTIDLDNRSARWVVSLVAAVLAAGIAADRPRRSASQRTGLP